MKIERVNDDTFPLAARVYAESWRASHKDICTPEFLRRRDCEGYLRRRMEGLYLIRDDGPVGVFRLVGEELSDLYILPGCQGRGYGSYAVAFAKETVPTLRLTVLSSNAGAIRLYEKMGFRFTGWDIPRKGGLLEREMRYTEKNYG